MERSPSTPSDLDALLGEADWVLRIARSLVRDEHAAQDLSQEVLGDALQAPPPLRGGRLRAWLWTIAKRRAGRQRRRELDRPAVEARAATAEAVTGDHASDRVRLHVELAQEIQALDAEDRRVLVGFFLEGQSQKNLASQEGCSPAALRKRISRAKDRLRERLDASSRGPDGWTAGLLALAFPGNATQAPPLPAAPSSASLALPAIAMKLAISLTAIAAVTLGVLRAMGPSSGVAATLDTGPLASVERATEDLQDATVDRAEALAAVTGEASNDRREMDAAPGANPREEVPILFRAVRILDESKAPLVDARGVWIGPDAAAVPLEADAEGVVKIPTGRAGRLFLAAAGQLGRMVRLEADEEPVEVILAPASSLKGRITVDGIAPGEPLEFKSSQTSNEMGLTERGDPSDAKLRQLLGLAPEGARRLRTDENGDFSYELEWSWRAARFWLTGEFLVGSTSPGTTAKPGADLDLPTDRETHLVDLIRLPAVTGRLVWSDDGSPVTGPLTYMLEDTRGRSKKMRGGMLSSEGRFALAPVEGRDDLDPATVGPDRRTTNGSPIVFAERMSLSLHYQGADFDTWWDISPEQLPMDLGDIEVPRLPLFSVQLQSSVDGEPIEGIVRGAARTGRTDSQGRASVKVEPGAKLQGIAMGYRLKTVELSAAMIEQQQGIVLELEPAPVLVVKSRPSSSDEPTLIVRLSFERTPFDSATLDEHDCGTAYDVSLLSALQGSGFRGGGWSHAQPGAPGETDYEIPRSGVLRIGGLAPDRPFTVVVFDGEADGAENRGPDQGERLRRELTLRPGETVLTVDR